MINDATYGVFIALFIIFIAIGFLGKRFRKGDLSKIEEWSLGGRNMGTIKLNISLFIYMSDSKPEIRMCDEHTDSKYVSAELLSDQEKFFIASHARGAEEFTPIDRLVIERYMPEAYRMYKSASVSRMKSTA